MTLTEFQPHVEQALVAYEWAIARAQWKQGLHDEREAIMKALPLAGSYGVEREPLEARLAQIHDELNQDVTADRVPLSPLRSIPMDLITAAVVRRLYRLPAEFPVLSIKTVPPAHDIADAVAAIARKWHTPSGAAVEETRRLASHV